MTIIQQQVDILDWSLRDDWRPTAEQAKILQQEIDPDWVEVKYPNIPYLPGAWYRKVFDEAFGIGAWSLIEAGQPHKAADGYYQGFVFKVGRVPIKKVAGWMATPGGNSVLSPGVALEGMRTNAIMRTAKDLGVARNLWLPAWCRRWLAANCDVVGTVGKGTKVYARKDDEAGHDALAFALDERALAEQAAASDPGNEAHIAEIVNRPRKKSADMHARNAAKRMQLQSDIDDHAAEILDEAPTQGLGGDWGEEN